MEHLLFEHIGGFELFELKSFENLAQTSFNDYMILCQAVNHISSLAVEDSVELIEHIKCLENGEIHPQLRQFLELNNVKVLHCDKALKNALNDLCIEQKTSQNIMRGIKANLHKIIKKEMNKQLILSVAHSRSKETIKYDMEREDNVVVHVGYEIDHLEEEICGLQNKIEKLINWYFPRFSTILLENTELMSSVLDGSNIDLGKEFEKFGKTEDLDILISEMVCDIKEEDKILISATLRLINEKKKLLVDLEEYLASKMKILAPNLREILGDRMCYKFIHKAGGLMNLSLYPSSTLQLLGAEKALFKSLKMKSRTPKYGLLYQLDYLKSNHGKMCRFIATKCSLAARIDCFGKERSGEYGMELRKMIEKKMKSSKNKECLETTADLLARVHKNLNKKETTEKVNEMD